MSDSVSDAKSGKVLQAAMLNMFPQLAHVKIDYCWGGLVDMTSDRLPRAGQHGGVFHSMGYSGHGVQMSVHMGQVMAEVMAGNAAANPWRELEWPAIPGHFGKPWFLPFVGRITGSRIICTELPLLRHRRLCFQDAPAIREHSILPIIDR